MKLWKRILCLTLALLMLLAVTACDSAPADKNDGDKPGNDDTQQTTDVDFGGKTVKVAVWYEPEKPTLGNTDSGDAWYYSLKNAEKEYNCEVEWIIETQEQHFSKFVQKSLSNEVYADIMMCHSWNYVSLIDQKLLEPTTEFVSNAKDAEHWNQSTYVLNGENWGIHPVSDNYIPTHYLLINTKLLNSLKLEHPQKLAREGKWDWETFRKYCAAATDASKEQYGVGCFMLASILKTANNFDYAVADKDGVYHNAFTYAETKGKGMEILELVQKMALEDKSILGTWTDGQEAMDEALNAFKDGKLLFAFHPTPSSLKKSGFTDYSVVTVPMGPSGTVLTDSVGAFAFWCLPTNSSFSAADRAAFWMEAKRTWDPADEEGYYEESRESRLEEVLDESYVNREDVEFLLDMGATMEFLPAVSLNVGSLIADDLFGAVIRGDSTPAAVINTTDGQLQAIIDATYNAKKDSTEATE
ncbi:MAG: extracellular solute-binding protein [Clostridia bacterium]|nr:extracellular solute-binding protein [Clostridia bacterium]